ncbi:MAG TPA: S8 family serine peptidase [Myxococcaceae bacterium]|nr:S8 family serine peptidase [Myxococcaceae bacterium]
MTVPTLLPDQEVPAAPLPVAERVGADQRFTGRGVVAAFLDAGFYAHPDLTEPENRIRDYVDLVGGRSGLDRLHRSDVSSWHGMMSSVVAAGNGRLSGGKYVSLAPEMELVLVKVGSAARIRHDDIAQGIGWAIAHRERYRIRVLNISCGGDHEASYLTDRLSQVAEAAVRAGIVVVCAVGNQGDRPGYVLPPASTPAVISVGGINDLGDPSLGRLLPYRSSYGPTVDGVQKPEIVTLADFIAAPILPGTPTAHQAELLTTLDAAADADLSHIISEHRGVYGPLDAVEGRQPYLIRQVIAAGLRDGLVIDEHYKRVDGTSFAAPIVSSVVAQMLQANPALTPSEVKRILMRTANRLPGIEPERQGWGALDPQAAVRVALEQS